MMSAIAECKKTRPLERQQKAGDVQILLDALKACSRTRNLEWGKQVHAAAVGCGHHCNIYIANALINMYAKCGSMADAFEVFDGIKHPTVVSWTALILGYADNGQGHIALYFFTRMRSEGPAPDSVTLVAAIKACTALAVKEGASQWAECRDRGKEIHFFAVDSGCISQIYVQNSLVDMYAKCGSISDAREVFDDMKHTDVVSWTALILGYAENGQGNIALDLFTRMRTQGPAADSVTLVASLKACTSLALNEGVSRWALCRERGKEIQNIIVQNGCNSDVYVQSTLIDMYSKCGSMVNAREVFDGMKTRTLVSWTALIMGYADNGEGFTSLDLFTRMRSEGLAPDSVTLVAALKACTSLAVREEASQRAECMDRIKEMHNFAVENHFSSDVFLQNTLIAVYVNLGNMVNAREVFDSMKHTTVVSWTTLILGYVDNGHGHTALEMFKMMRMEGPEPDSVAIVAALKACTSLGVKEGSSACRKMGKIIHSIAVEFACNSDVFVQNALIDMFAKCCSMVDARVVFDDMKYPDVVSWTALILGYTENCQGDTALDMFTRSPAPNSVTIVAALKACTSLAVHGGVSRRGECLDRGNNIFNIAVENGCYSDVYVQSTLVDMYAKCGSIANARDVFDSMKYPTVMSWTALILGYADAGQGHAALNLFSRMRNEGLAPDFVTLGAALKACGLTGALEFGRIIHSELGNDLDAVLLNCLIDFYAKCGSLVEAQILFDFHSETRDIKTWNALLAGYGTCGDNETVFALFKGMQEAGFKPDGITFMCILMCCSHAGLVVKGKECFDSMSTKYDVVPTVRHYTCMIDLFGRANKLDDAMALLARMPCSPDDVTWMTILGSCRKWKNFEIGKLAFQSLNDIDVEQETNI